MATFASSIELTELSPNVYETLQAPTPMGSAATRAFGGVTMSVAISAAFRNLPSQYHLYSVLGNFLGPAQNGRKYVCKVREIRTTKTFVTRGVDVSQVQTDGKSSRAVMSILADFQTAEEASMLVYSKPPSMNYPSAEETPSLDELQRGMVDRDLLSADEAAAYRSYFSAFVRLIERRFCPDGFATQVLNGLAKHLPTTQDALPLTSRASAEWIRMREPLSTPVEHLSALAYVQDGSIAFCPLTHSHAFIPDAAACGTLDFALRVFTNDFDFNRWYLRELKTMTGGCGRTYSEAVMWDEEGKMVSSMTQQSILRPWKATGSKI